MESDSSTKKSYNKRKKTLMHKLDEITTLCGIKASLIIYSDLEDDIEGPVTWPANARQVHEVTSKLKVGIEMGISGPKIDDLESMIETSVCKEKLKLARLELREDDKIGRMLVSDYIAGKDVSGMSIEELNVVMRIIDESQSRVGYRMSQVKEEEEAMAAGLSIGRGGEDEGGPSGTKGKEAAESGGVKEMEGDLQWGNGLNLG